MPLETAAAAKALVSWSVATLVCAQSVEQERPLVSSLAHAEVHAAPTNLGQLGHELLGKGVAVLVTHTVQQRVERFESCETKVEDYCVLH